MFQSLALSLCTSSAPNVDEKAGGAGSLSNDCAFRSNGKGADSSGGAMTGD